MSQLSGHTLVKPDAVDVARSALENALADLASMDRTGRISADDSWGLPADEQYFVGRVIAHLKPQHILELGSGVSTEMLARASAQLDDSCCITSLEHDPDFLQSTINKLAEKGLAGSRIAVQLAPVVLRECGGKLLPFYRLWPDRFASSLPVDLVLIDGPPAVLGGREGTLYQVLDSARRGTLVLLDDADRAEERAVISRWQDNLGDAIEVKLLPDFSHGMAAILVHESIGTGKLWEHRLRLCRQELGDLIPADKNFILVDQNETGAELGSHARAIPFLEREGEYFGPPPDDITAIRELQRLRESGATFMAFLWPAFWWFEHYSGFTKFLRSSYRCDLENDRLVVFDLRA